MSDGDTYRCGLQAGHTGEHRIPGGRVTWSNTGLGNQGVLGDLVESKRREINATLSDDSPLLTNWGTEAVNHHSHYNANPSGVECIDVIEHMSFNVGSAIKYLWRAGLKGEAVEDLRKAAWYANREIARLAKAK
jgi:hypothetical protein